MNGRKYTAAKATVAAIGTVITALAAAFADDVLSHNEVAGLVSTVVLGAISVYSVWKVPNREVPSNGRPSV
jgi:hypothetical protein